MKCGIVLVRVAMPVLIGIAFAVLLAIVSLDSTAASRCNTRPFAASCRSILAG